MNLIDLRDKLLEVSDETSTSVPVYHYNALEQTDNYIVWAEDAEAGSSHADNQKVNQVLQGTIDYFTKIEFDPIFDRIQEKINQCDIAWRLNSIQHEEVTGYIHYEWVWEMI